MAVSSNWNAVIRRAGVDPIGPGLLRGLIDGDFPVLIIKDLLPSQSFAEGRTCIKKMFDQASTTYYANGHLTTIGPYLAKYLDNVDDYFRDAALMNSLASKANFTLADEVRGALAEIFLMDGLHIATEADGRDYGSLCVRIHPDGVANPMHNDMIIRDAAGMDLIVAQLLYQLSCVICVQECVTGGESKIYSKRWEPADERFKVPGGLGYEYGVVENLPAYEFKPQVRDVYIINPTNYHEILRVGGDDRLTVGFFIGFSDDTLQSGITWG